MLEVIRVDDVLACISKVKSRAEVNKWVDVLGINVQSSLEGATHLVSSGSMTDKLLRALLRGCAIVEPSWLQALANGKFVDPKTLDVDDYSPQPPNTEILFGFRGKKRCILQYRCF